MKTGGLRERNKARTRALIADTAAQLFGERGYENVAVVDVSRAAEVSEQTVYNYFPTKEALVLDRDEQVRDSFVARIRDRDPRISPAAAVREEALGLAESIRHLPPEALRGSLGYLATISPTVRRLSLEMTDRLGDAIAAALRDTTPELPPSIVKVHAIALAWLSQTVIDEGGRRIQESQSPNQIADELRPIVEAITDELDTWFTDSRRSHVTSQDTVTVLIEIHAEAGQEKQARDALLHAIQTSEKPGLISSTEYEDRNDSGALYALQVWENADAFHAHMTDAAETGMSAAIQVLRERPKTAVLRTID